MPNKTLHTSNQRTTNQLLDYYLIPELIEGRPAGYATRVQGRISEHNIVVSKSTIYSRAQRVINGTTTLHPSAEFHGVPGNREGKDQNYSGFWSMLDCFIPREERFYIGLPSNQIDRIKEQVGGWIFVCERDTDHAEQLKHLAAIISARPHNQAQIIVIHGDIFNFMETNIKFNVFDLDLMQNLPDEFDLKWWVHLLRTSTLRGSTIGINLIATIGRSITEEEHNKRTIFFRDALRTEGFRELGYSRFAYRDRRIPMRAERFILKRR